MFKIEKSEEPFIPPEPEPKEEEPKKEHKKFKIFKIEQGRATPPINKEPTIEIEPEKEKKPGTPLPTKR